MIEITPLSAGEEDAWDAFLLGHAGGLIYQSSRYRDWIAEHLGCETEYLVAREGGEIRGVLPVMWADDDSGKVCNSLPFYGSHGGPVAATGEAERALIDSWNERVQDGDTLAGTMVGNPFLDRRPPDPDHNLTDERISQVTPLPADNHEDALMEAFTKNARRDVRRAERRGVEVTTDDGRLDDLCAIHQENIRAVGGSPKSAELFESIPRHFTAGEDFDLWVARLGEAMVGGLLVFYFNDVAEYFTPAVDREHQADEPMALILHRAMSEAARRGCHSWNWGGTWATQDGVYRFKRKWGAEESRYSYFVQVNDDALLDSTPEELLGRFEHFYVAPFSALRSREVTK